MIKQIWTVRSPQRLFSGLAAAVTGLFQLYTVTSLFYLPWTVPFRLIGLQSKYCLLILPAVMMIVFLFWIFRIHSNTVLIGVRKAKHEAVVLKQKKLSRDYRTAAMMLWTVGLGFLQLDMLNTVKQMQGFGLFIPVVCLFALVAVSIRYRIKLHGIRVRYDEADVV